MYVLSFYYAELVVDCTYPARGPATESPGHALVSALTLLSETR